MNKVNQLVICKEDYKDYEDFKNAIKDAVMILLDNNYIMTLKYDANDKNMGIVVIEFNYANQEYGDRYPSWLYPEEEDSVVWKE